MKILLTGGAGYIGSITNKYLIDNGFETIVFDNLKNGHKQAINDTPLIVGDLTDKNSINKVFKENRIDSVIHFAALALAGESMQKPSHYYHNNIIGGVNLLEAMRQGRCNNIVFSSTCAVYGYPRSLPVTEEEEYKPVSVYGSSKKMFEEILVWYEKLFGIKHAILRYFNAAGALLDGSIGEQHNPETHIIPLAIEVALGKSKNFTLFGNDYDTHDGTCIRDYIHVLDLASSHTKALSYIKENDKSLIANVGVGKGYSNMEVLDMITRVTGKNIPVEVSERRPGDPDSIYADSQRIQNLLNWKPEFSSLETIIKSAWEWHRSNPDGFKS